MLPQDTQIQPVNDGVSVIRGRLDHNVTFQILPARPFVHNPLLRLHLPLSVTWPPLGGRNGYGKASNAFPGGGVCFFYAMNTISSHLSVWPEARPRSLRFAEQAPHTG